VSLRIFFRPLPKERQFIPSFLHNVLLSTWKAIHSWWPKQVYRASGVTLIRAKVLAEYSVAILGRLTGVLEADQHWTVITFCLPALMED
jgi:hypothetical protein